MPTLRVSAEKGLQSHHWVCLLLALSFLYNPFLAAAASGSGLNVRHTASYRATVAASELQQLAPMGDERSYLLTDLFTVEVLLVLPELTSQFLLPPAREPLPPQKLFCSNSWFRPPPAL